jgi:hypothetical protein
MIFFPCYVLGLIPILLVFYVYNTINVYKGYYKKTQSIINMLNVVEHFKIVNNFTKWKILSYLVLIHAKSCVKCNCIPLSIF